MRRKKMNKILLGCVLGMFLLSGTGKEVKAERINED